MSFLLNHYKIFFSSSLNHFLAIFILSIYPLFFFMGTGVLNTCIVLLDLIFIIDIINKKKFSFLKNYTFYSLSLFWLILLTNLLFSIDQLNSLGRTLGFIRFIFFVMLLIYYFNLENQKYQKIILSSWLTIFIIVSLDLIYEILTGQNILGYKSYMPGRLAGFFHDELIIGHFYYAFVLIILVYLGVMS